MEKKSLFRRVAGTILIILSVAFTIYLSVIMVNRIKMIVLKDTYITIFKYELVICALFLLLSVDIRFGLLTKLKALFFKITGWALRIVLVLAVGFVLFLAGKITVEGMIQTPGTAENAIVLGLALQNGQPAPDLIDRVDTAAEYSREYPYSKLILTGGNPDKNGMTEAAVMKDLLIERGIDPAKMVLEDKAQTTKDNFLNTAKVIDPARPVVLISSDYHMYRAVNTAEDAGFTYIIRRPAPSSPVEYGVNVMWEVIQELNRLKAKI